MKATPSINPNFAIANVETDSQLNADSVLRHYQRLGGNAPMEDARANTAENAEQVNTLQQLFTQTQMPATPLCPSSSTKQWLESRGLDSTGHTQNDPLENYITGDESA